MTTEQSSPPTIAVRQYRPADHATVTKIFVEGLMKFDDNSDYQYLWEERLRKDLTNDFADIEGSHIAPGGNFWVATATTTNSTQVVGIIGLQRRSETKAEIRRLFVDPSCHRMGIGRKLMTEVETWSKQHGIQSLFLTTNPKSSRALAFYAALGYQDVHENEFFWEKPKYFEVCKLVKLL